MTLVDILLRRPSWSRKTVCPKQPNIMTRLPMFGKVSQDLPHDTTEFVAMTRKSSRDHDLGPLGMGINDKVSIRGIGEQTGAHGQGGSLS
jgi:hypothetical protein